MIKISYGIHQTPFGDYLLAITSKHEVCFGAFVDQATQSTVLARAKQRWPLATFVEEHKQTQPLMQQLLNAATRDRVPFVLTGTPFQKNVWQALLGIREGDVTTYAAIAQQIGRPTAVRAVANAIANNNISVLIPCHRVIATSGALSGYRWGIERKKALLLSEQRQDKQHYLK